MAKERRFGIATIIGKEYFDYGQITFLVRKKAESPSIDWEVPDSPKKCKLYATDPESQCRAIQVLKDIFRTSAVLYFFTTQNKSEEVVQWEGCLFDNIDALMSKVAQMPLLGLRIPDVVVLINSCMPNQFVDFQLLVETFPEVRTLQITLAT